MAQAPWWEAPSLDDDRGKAPGGAGGPVRMCAILTTRPNELVADVHDRTCGPIWRRCGSTPSNEIWQPSPRSSNRTRRPRCGPIR